MKPLLTTPACLLVLTGTITPTALYAQRLAAPTPVGWAPSVHLTASHSQWRSSLTVPRTKVGDYRIEGTVVGSLLLGAFGAWIGSASCQSQPTPVGGSAGPDCTGATLTVGFVGTVLGGGLGYLLGRGTPKYRLAPTQP